MGYTHTSVRKFSLQGSSKTVRLQGNDISHAYQRLEPLVLPQAAITAPPGTSVMSKQDLSVDICSDQSTPLLKIDNDALGSSMNISLQNGTKAAVSPNPLMTVNELRKDAQYDLVR